MKVGLATIAYNEERMIKPFLSHIPNWIDETVVLLSEKPWNGEELEPDKTEEIAREQGATVIKYPWKTEEEQRNAGQEYFSDMDWVIVLDPDEFLDDDGWEILRYNCKDDSSPTYCTRAIVQGQYTYWKDGYVANPPKDYQQLILVDPQSRFVDKRVIDNNYIIMGGLWIHHFSWAKTDEEAWRKISHYAHSEDFDIKDWYENVWKKWKPGMKDVHPVTPDTLHELIPAKLPKEIEELGLWPN